MEVTLAAISGRRGQGAFDAPSLLQSALDAGIGQARLTHPVGQHHSPIIQREFDAIRTISILREWIGPSNIARLVSASIVYSVNGVFRRWARTNEREERIERVAPLGADRDPGGAIPRVAPALGIVAPVDHAAPALILAGLPSSVNPSVFQQEFAPDASTRAGVAGFQVSGWHADALSAVALAQPPLLLGRDVLRSIHWFERGEAAESLTAQVCWLEAHDSLYRRFPNKTREKAMEVTLWIALAVLSMIGGFRWSRTR